MLDIQRKKKWSEGKFDVWVQEFAPNLKITDFWSFTACRHTALLYEKFQNNIKKKKKSTVK